MRRRATGSSSSGSRSSSSSLDQLVEGLGRRGSFALGRAGRRSLGDCVRDLVLIQNSGALFGLFQRPGAPVRRCSASASSALIVWYHGRAGRDAQLAGDGRARAAPRRRDRQPDRPAPLRLRRRLRGHRASASWRFYTFNVADAAISIVDRLLLVAVAILPAAASGAGRPRCRTADAAASGPSGPGGRGGPRRPVRGRPAPGSRGASPAADHGRPRHGRRRSRVKAEHRSCTPGPSCDLDVPRAAARPSIDAGGDPARRSSTRTTTC